MSVARGCLVVVSAAALLAGFFHIIQDVAALQTPDSGQVVERKKPEVDFSMLPTDRLARRRIEAAEDYVKAKEWPEVVRILQPLLDTSEDVLIPDPRQKDDKETQWVSLRGEADRLLMALPEEGREYYEHNQGVKAAALLKTARETNDDRLLTEIVQRYAHTQAGAAALDLLAAGHLDRGRIGDAAACYRWLLRQPLDKLDDHVLYRAWLALHLDGDKALEEQTWKRLAAQAPKGVRFGDNTLGLHQLRGEGARVAFGAGSSGDAALFRGDAQRSGRGAGGMPLLQARWWAGTAGGIASEAWLAAAARSSESLATGSTPNFFPLAVGDRVVARGQGGIYAFDLATGRLLWRTPTPLGLDGMLGDPTYNKTVQFKDWAAHQGNARELILQNTTLGTLSSDGSRVYAVEDVVLPPPPEYFVPQQPTQPGQRVAPHSFGPPELKDAVHHNRLRAIDLATGRVAWEAGGLGGKGLVNDAFFLGPPVPVAGVLYAVVEKKREIRLVCLHPNSGQPLWSQLLAESRDPVLQDPVRRGRAAQPALGDGVLLCPTNIGALVAVDLLSRRLAWAYAYARSTPAANTGDPNVPGQPPNNAPAGGSWQASAPVIHDGKVIYTPPDSDLICCINLRDGKELWQAKRADDLYLACVHQGRVVLVGRNAFRALNLANGAELWQTATGLPSGVGALSGSTYYLPLRKGAIAAVDIVTGRLLASSRAAGGEVPGNLLFHHDEVLSQTIDRISVYPQLSVRLAELDKNVEEHPDDAEALLERAKLRLNLGRAEAAMADLRAVLARALRSEDSASRLNGALQSRARRCLYDALAALLPGREKSADQEPILKMIAAEWQGLADNGDVESAEHFVALFGDLVPVGLEARLWLAEWWLEGKAWGSGLEAELHLVRVRDQRVDPRLAARATEALARLYTRKGLFEDALECYRALGREYPEIVVRDGRTGGDLLRDAASDRRFLPSLDDTGYAWPGGRVRAQVLPGHAAKPSLFIPIEPEGREESVLFRRYQLGIDVSGSRFVLLDRATGAEVWSHRDRNCLVWKDMVVNDPAHDFSLPCQARGHLVVVGSGPAMFGFDLLNRRLLWQKDLAQSPNLPSADRADLLNFEWVGPMGAGCVCIQCDTGLYGIDPLNGTVLWTRADVYPNTQGFGDDDHLYLVEMVPEGMNGTARGNRAIRLRDGAVVTVPSFLEAYQQQGTYPPLGRCLLRLEESNLSLDDAHTGKKVWRTSFPKGTPVTQMASMNPAHVGVLEGGEKVTILDAVTGKALLSTKLNRKDIENAAQIALVEDRLHFYLVAASQPAPQAQNEQFERNVMHGLQAIPADGKIFAFDRNTGKLKWDVATLTHPSLRGSGKSGSKAAEPPIRSLQLVLERFDESPVLFLTIARQRPNQAANTIQLLPGGLAPGGKVPAPNPNENKLAAATVAIDKVSGKLIHAMVHREGTRPYFHALRGDPRGGSIEFVSGDQTIRFTRGE